MSGNPSIHWKPEIDYAASGAETAGFVLEAADAVADHFGYAEEDLYLANFDKGRTVIEYEDGEETTKALLEQEVGEPMDIGQYRGFLENVGRENIIGMKNIEQKPSQPEFGSGLPLGSSWSYEAEESFLHLWLTTEDNVFDVEDGEDVGFSGEFYVTPYSIKTETVERERDTLSSSLRKSIGLEPKTYEKEKTSRRGPHHVFRFVESSELRGPQMGDIETETIRSVYQDVKDSEDYSLQG